jgi:hypothetical protein
MSSFLKKALKGDAGLKPSSMAAQNVQVEPPIQCPEGYAGLLWGCPSLPA